MKVPEICPLCESKGTVWFQEYPKQAHGEGGRTATFKHASCYCTSCGESFIPVRLMDVNVSRVREAIEKAETT